MENFVQIIGGGLAGSEAAWQVATRGMPVRLYEMRPTRMTRAHQTENLAELVCSNSFRGAELSQAVGLLKFELRALRSLIMECGDLAAVPAGGAMAVDRERFSELVTQRLQAHPLITIVRDEVTTLPEFSRTAPLIIATGPLTSAPLARELIRISGSDQLAFYDAISPIITAESLDMNVIFRQSRYEKGGGDDYLNLPLSRDEYTTFVQAVAVAEKFSGHEEVEGEPILDLRPFEGCMPIEDMIARGPETLRFGPFKPVGLEDPRTGERPFAVCQLRQDNREGTLWSMVGMQTRMKHPEQLRIFRSLPGLANAEFVRLGSVHRNTFLNSPACINPTLEFRSHPGLFIAGQVSGTEGYVESTAGGMAAGLNALRVARGEVPIEFPRSTAHGSLFHYISDNERKNFQPMNISFGLIASYFEATYSKLAKKDRRLAVSKQALLDIEQLIKNFDLLPHKETAPAVAT